MVWLGLTTTRASRGPSAGTSVFGLVVPGIAVPFVDGRLGPILALKLPLCPPDMDR